MMSRRDVDHQNVSFMNNIGYPNNGGWEGGTSSAFSSDARDRDTDVMFGQGNDLVLNGYSNGGNNESDRNSTFDLTDFPSLGTAAMRQNQLLMAHQQMLQNGNGKYRLATSNENNGAFNMASEDFPALPGAPPSSSGSNSNLVLGGSGLLDSLPQQQQQQQQQQRDVAPPPVSSSSSVGSGYNPSSSVATPGRGSANGSNIGNNNSGGVSVYDLENNSTQQSLGGGNSGLTVSSHQQRTTSNSAPSPAGSALSGDYGLLGLLSVIRMSDADRNALALGSDLTLLGLNLNSSEQLYSTFAGPWSDSPTTREPQYQLPMCYYMQPPALKTGHLSKFHLETLFYIFYALPKDVLQAYAAQELYARDFRYHVDLKLWFKRASPADGVPNSNNGVQYIYFDINSWERRLFTGNMHHDITSGLLPEEDVRVKFPNS